MTRFDHKPLATEGNWRRSASPNFIPGGFLNFIDEIRDEISYEIPSMKFHPGGQRVEIGMLESPIYIRR